MSPLFRLLGTLKKYKIYTFLGVTFHLITALLTVLSIPMIIPFFHILFGISPSDYQPPESIWDLEDALNYGFSRLIALSDHLIALQIVCIAVVIIYFLKNVSRFLVSYFMVFVRNGLLRDLRTSIWEGFESLSLSERYGEHQGYLMSLITNDLNEVDHGILKVFEMLFKTPLVIIGSFIFMIWLNPQLTCIAFGLILFTLVIVGGVSHILKSQSAKAQNALAIINVIADQFLSATKLIKTHHGGGYFKKKFEEQNESYFVLSNKMLRRRDLASPLAEFLGVITIVILLFCGTHSVFNDEMEPGTFFAFIFAFYNIIDPAKSFSREFANVQKGIAALDRIELFRARYKSQIIAKNGLSIDFFKTKITFHNVAFSFPENVNVLNNLDLVIQKGERIGIVGPSGVGKTTIFDLLLGFYTPGQGVISMDHHDIQDFDLVQYRKLFGLVTQESILFHGTIKDNILLDMVEDDYKLTETIRMVGLDHSFLEKQVGDRATMISGGEAQRICLARVLYRSPEIFLLDEPISQLDGPSLVDLMETIMTVTKGQTVLMITHQTKLLKDMDRIIVVDEGQIVAQGQYDTLYERNDVFRSLLGV